jgi:hypothetical protein
MSLPVSCVALVTCHFVILCECDTLLFTDVMLVSFLLKISNENFFKNGPRRKTGALPPPLQKEICSRMHFHITHKGSGNLSYQKKIGFPADYRYHDIGVIC